MSAVTKLFVSSAVLISLVVCLLAFCCWGVLFTYRGDGHTSLNGEVVGADDKPIADAEVRLFEAGKQSQPPSVTDVSGQYSVGLTHAPSDLSLAVTVSKHGYKPYRKEFKVSERETFPKKIVLESDLQAPVPPKE